jgi:hypothetical protein
MLLRNPEACITALYTLFYSFTRGERSPEHLMTYNDAARETIIKLILTRSLDPFLLHGVDPKRLSPISLKGRSILAWKTLCRRLTRKDELIRLGSLEALDLPRSARDQLAEIERNLARHE